MMTEIYIWEQSLEDKLNSINCCNPYSAGNLKGKYKKYNTIFSDWKTKKAGNYHRRNPFPLLSPLLKTW